MNAWIKTRRRPLLAALSVFTLPAAMAGTNLVTNGGFETGSGLGQIDSVHTASGWTQQDPSNFNFVLDTTADDDLRGVNGGFASIYSAGAGTHIFVWGPDNGVNNGFTSSSDGGRFLGGDGGYATGAVYQTVNGLKPGSSYTLSFEWAGAQFTDAQGDYWVGWQVGFGTDKLDVGGVGSTVPSKGFLPWQTAVLQLTATSTTQVLSFLATGPSGLPPFSLLDGVSLTENAQTPPVPEPAAAALLLAGIGGLVLMQRMRRRRG